MINLLLSAGAAVLGGIFCAVVEKTVGTGTAYITFAAFTAISLGFGLWRSQS